jgi:signal transduction histidine kinase
VEDFHKTHELKSVAVLALEKFSQPLWNKVRSQVVLHGQTSLTQSTVQINFWEPVHTFSQIDVKSLCIASLTFDRCVVPPNAPDAQTVRNKIVLIDLPQEYLDTFGTLSPFGNRMSVAEVQASLVASLMTNSFRRTMPAWCDYTITTLGAAFISWLIAAQMAKSKFSYSFRNIWFLLSVVGVYTSLSLLFSWHRLVLPLTVPVLTWLVTGVTVAICLLFWQKQQQFAQQQRKLAERQAILSQARKLLHRVASDIHDGPLQELKLVMDGIELLAVNNPTINPNPLLDRLEAVGRDLRARLRNTRTMAEKLEITPELHSGLDKGIRQHLQHLVSSGELTLKVEARLQPLLELESDSTWIDAREDIFRFFKEAIANVIRHAQPPNGTATRVTVSLVSQGIQGTLSVENDAIQPEHPTLESTSRRKHIGGYGTKLMATVAAELPGGYWERVPLADGGMQVILTWTLDATAQDKTQDYLR